MVSEIDTSMKKYASVFEIANKNNSKILSQEEIKNFMKQDISDEELKKIYDEINKLISSQELSERRVEMHVNEDINRIIITIYDANSNEIVQEIPCRELQNLALYLKKAIGILYDKQA